MHYENFVSVCSYDMPVEVADKTTSDGMIKSSENDTHCDKSGCSYMYHTSDHHTEYVNTGLQLSTAGNITDDSNDYLKPTNSVDKK